MNKEVKVKTDSEVETFKFVKPKDSKRESITFKEVTQHSSIEEALKKNVAFKGYYETPLGEIQITYHPKIKNQ